MSEFERTHTPIDFSESDDSPIEIVLKFKDDFEGTWERNENNTLRFREMKMFLSQPRTCYFQKQQPDEKKNRSRHKIFVPIENEKAIEMSVVLWQDKIDDFTTLNSYFAGKAKEIVFIPPLKDVYQRECLFRVVSVNYKDGTNSDNFTQLYKHVDALNIPTVDINKERDKQIWDNYVKALKKLVKQKETVWKIQKVSQPYTDNSGNGERYSYVDITISEEDLNKQFEEEIVKLFPSNELNDYAVNKDTAFIKFDTYRILSSTELSQLNTIASEYFFELSPETPTNAILGELSFKYTDDDSKEEIYNQIRQKLSDDYDYDNLQITPEFSTCEEVH